jgi:biotin operon repressor
MSSSPVSDRLRKLAQELSALADRIDRGDAPRSAFVHVVAEIAESEEEIFGPRPPARRGEGAKGRILTYLQENLGRPVSGRELAAISGIQEWARRVRELRVEEGFDIAEVGGGTYRLDSAEPDLRRRDQWRTANEIRNRPGSARSRIEAFLQANVGEIVTREQLDYVSKIAEGSRRIRELRDESGWPIASHIDEPDLEPGSYRLLSTDPADRRDTLQRLYPDDLRSRVFERDEYRCTQCGRDLAQALAEGDTRFYLEVHHKVAVADELAALPAQQRNEISNLVTLCHRDHVQETGQLQRRKRARRKGPQ